MTTKQKKKITNQTNYGMDIETFGKYCKHTYTHTSVSEKHFNMCVSVWDVSDKFLRC